MTSNTAFFTGDSKVKTTWGTIGLIVGLTAAGVAAWVSSRNAISSVAESDTRHGLEITGLDIRVKKLEENQTAIAVMQNDVQWIRQTLEQQRRAGP